VTSQEAIDLGARLTYKPGWEIRIVASKPPAPDGVSVYVSAHLPNARPDLLMRGHEMATLYVSYGVEIDEREVSGMDREAFLEKVSKAIQALEAHEHQEWFKVDGWAVRDPHAKE
jgi:hypothetical protein